MKKTKISLVPSAEKKGKKPLNATKCEAFLVSAFDLLVADKPGVIENAPIDMHRQMVGSVEVDVLVQKKGGQQYYIFCDGSRFHGGSSLNGGPNKIISDEKRRRALLQPGVTIVNLREHPLPDLAVGENVPVSDLCKLSSELLAAVGARIWGEVSVEVRLLADPDFLKRVQIHCAEHWFPLLSRHVPQARRLKNLVSPEVLADLIVRCQHVDAANFLPDSGCGTKATLMWRCSSCSLLYPAKINALLADTESKGCPSCGGSKQVVLEKSVAGTPELAADFIEVVNNPSLTAAQVSYSSYKMIKWRCRTPLCHQVCIDRPANRRSSTGYCRNCGRNNRRFHESWCNPAVVKRVRAVINKLIDANTPFTWKMVFASLEATDQAYLREMKPTGPSRSKFGYKMIRCVRAQRM